MAFDINELRLYNDSEEELLRTRSIFEVLKKKANNNEFLTEHEKEFFCQGVKLSHLDDGNVEDYSCCDNYRFKELYLVYFQSLVGGIPFYKVQGTNIYQVSIEDVRNDLQYLYSKSDEWELVIQKTNHTDQLLQQVSKEAREDLRNLINHPDFAYDPFSIGSFRFRYKKKGILLQSKYVYYMSIEFFERTKPEDLIIEINSLTIEFNEYSIIHIINRHFAETTKPYNPKKSFHTEDFMPSILSSQLRDIINIIDSTKLLSGKSIDKIGFQQTGIDYIVWTSEKIKSIKGKGNVNYRRLDTFYPVTDTSELDNLRSACDLHKIKDDLSVYVPK